MFADFDGHWRVRAVLICLPADPLASGRHKHDAAARVTYRRIAAIIGRNVRLYWRRNTVTSAPDRVPVGNDGKMKHGGVVIHVKGF